ncbi:MAG: hypothetical protein JWO31_689, partial [Phycisphaerales bacterium]|nr:hypothetical protein [Phycisphaerales bacterium]
MHDRRLRRALDTVSGRYRRLLWQIGLAACWLALAVAGLAALAWWRGAGRAVPLVTLVLMAVLLAALLPPLLRAVRVVRDPLWVARRLERKFPDLDTRLLAAVEQAPGDGPEGHLTYLQRTVVDEALDHAARRRWEQVVPDRALRATAWAHGLTLAGLATVLIALAVTVAARPGGPAAAWDGQPGAAADFDLKVEPGDASVERGTSLVVLARFGRDLPADAALVVRGADGQPHDVPMSKSLDDPVFAARVPAVDADLAYAVRYGPAAVPTQTRWYKAAVFEHPELKQADAKLTFPTYTGAPEKDVADTRSVTAVEGTKAALTFRLNKSVAGAVLVPKVSPAAANGVTTNPADPPADDAPQPITLTPDPADPSVYTAAVEMKHSARYTLQLTDADGRASKRPAELAVNVTPNKPPELKLDFPAMDVDVSPLEELTLRAKVSDDFGVRRAGVSYTIAGRPAADVVLAENVAGRDKRDVAHTVALEKLAAEPDQLLSYYFWAEDVGPDGAVRRTAGDMFFAEVRPFEEIYRQGEQPDEQQQQQQQQKSSQNAQRAEEAAEGEKQIIAATWKVIRRETSAKPSAAFAPDVKLIAESQAEAREKAEAMGEKLTDARSQSFLKNVLKQMDAAAAALTEAAEKADVGKLASAALPAEQAAYQELLKLRAREHEVVKGQRQQGAQKSASSASSRRQRQLDQLKLTDEKNRYEQQRAAGQQQDQNPQERETRQVLSRLKDLAQRQEDLNRQMKEMQSALAEAKEPAKQEEIKRQLARLREQQREQLRDTDELRDRMD